jgi:short-subunit dehydrogenase
MIDERTRPLAMVTGASSGIGLELARQLARRGYDLVVAAEDEGIEDAATELRREGTQVETVIADLADGDGVDELVTRTAAIGTPDVVAVNAGVGTSGPFAESDLDAELNLVDLNVREAVHLTRAVLPAMVQRGDGGILFTSSIAGTMPGPYQATYNASKAFLLSFAEALRVEVEDSGVRVTALMPGPTDTDFFARAGLEDTKLGQAKKDDPAEVAEEGIDALLAGKDHVVAGSAKNRVQAAAAKVLPQTTTAKAHASMSAPGSGATDDSTEDDR